MESGPASLRTSFCSGILLALIAIAMFFGPARADAPPKIGGIWYGTVDMGQRKVPIVIHVSVDQKGGISVLLDSPDENAWGIPADTSKFSGSSLSFGISDRKIVFNGTLSGVQNKIDGTWTQNGYWSTILTYQSPEPPYSKLSAVDGDWIGVLRSPRFRTLRVGLHITTISGREQAWFYSFDQGAKPFSCSNTHIADSNFSLDVPTIHAKYAGKLSADGKSIEGAWNQSSPQPLDFVRVRSASEQMADAHKRPARPPIKLSRLGSVLDRELAPQLADGLLSKATGGGVSIGVIDHEHRRVFSYGAAKPESIFEIASISKTFTALALAQLVEQKKVTLDEPVRELLPAGTVAKPAGPEITLSDLATHHSGLPRLAPNMDMNEDVDSFAKYDNGKLREYFAKNGIAAPVEPSFLYSNFGFSLLGYALASREGDTYDQLIRTEVTAPLNLNDTAVRLTPAQELRMMQGYNSAFDKFEHGAYDYDMFAGAGGIKSTAPDLLTYLAANLHPQRILAVQSNPQTATLPPALKLEHQLRADVGPGVKIALGWMYDEKRHIYFHDGGALGYSSHLEFDPARDRAIVVLYNRLDDTPGRGRFVDRIAQNVNALLNGEQTPRLDYLPEHERAVIALALFTNRAIDGTYHCRVNAFALPASSKDPYAPTGTGEMQLIADGTGTFTRGTWQHHIRAPGLKLDCDLKLKSGSYSVRPDGTGNDETRWELQPGKDQDQCSQFFPAFRQATATNPQLIVPDRDSGTFYVSVISEIATLGVVCQR